MMHHILIQQPTRRERHFRRLPPSPRDRLYPLCMSMKRSWAIVSVFLPATLPLTILLLALLLLTTPLFAADAPAGADEAEGKPATAAQLKALDRDIAAADAAAAKRDLDAALAYVDYTGHEQEALARAMLQYGARQAELKAAVTKHLGKKAWPQAAKALGLPDRPRPARSKRTARVIEGVLFVRSTEAGTEVPYVKIDGVWKLSIREVVYLALRKAGVTTDVEEAVLFTVAGKTAKLLEKRNQHLHDLAEGVKAGELKTVDDLKRKARQGTQDEE